MEFQPLSTLKHVMRYGMNYVNLLIIDMAQNTHVAVYDFDNETFVNFHTGNKIDDPVMWSHLPSFNAGIFEALVDNMDL